MTKMDILTQKVKDGITHHEATCLGACAGCPYQKEMGYCMRAILNDANEVIDYWKGKYENTVLQQPMMIIDTGSRIISDPSDIRDAEKKTKAMKILGNAANFATEALQEATKALRALKEEMKDD